MADLRIRLYNHKKPPLRNSSYAPRISEQKWQSMEPEIRAMFSRGLTVKQMLEKLHRHHNFRPSRGQLVTRISSWGLRTYRLRNALDVSADDGNHEPTTFQVRTVYFDNLIDYLKVRIVMTHCDASSRHVDWRCQQITMLRVFEMLSWAQNRWVDNQTCLSLDDLASVCYGRDYQLMFSKGTRKSAGSTPSRVLIPFLGATSKTEASAAQVASLRHKLLQQLQRRLGQMTTHDQYDIEQFHVIMCLAAESISKFDQHALIIHKQGAHAMLQGMLQLWGEGSHVIFGRCIDSFRALDSIDLSHPLQKDWLEQIFRRNLVPSLL